jgi:hypothetical protein
LLWKMFHKEKEMKKFMFALFAICTLVPAQCVACNYPSCGAASYAVVTPQVSQIALAPSAVYAAPVYAQVAVAAAPVYAAPVYAAQVQVAAAQVTVAAAAPPVYAAQVPSYVPVPTPYAAPVYAAPTTYAAPYAAASYGAAYGVGYGAAYGVGYGAAVVRQRTVVRTPIFHPQAAVVRQRTVVAAAPAVYAAPVVAGTGVNVQAAPGARVRVRVR